MADNALQQSCGGEHTAGEIQDAGQRLHSFPFIKQISHLLFNSATSKPLTISFPLPLFKPQTSSLSVQARNTMYW